mmetsp:Transcript_21550/g.37764  ORF Transcript_21550/g.37764 Transcript_21550/m.37764 type:complete len:280 (-) Transcript_21550:102-941(-)
MADPYRVEPAKSGRSTCKASKEPIAKGELRFGSLVDIGGHETYHWRKLAYITEKQVSNVETKMGGVDKVGGFEDLSTKQQGLLRKAFEKAAAAGKKKEKEKEKVAKAKAKAKSAKDKAKLAKAKAKAKAVAAKEKAKAAKEAKKAKALGSPKSKPAAATEHTAEGSAPEAKKPRSARASLDPGTLKLAHQALDLAKSAKWRELFSMLDKHPALVDARPPERKYTILHQAAWHGSKLAVDTLIDKYGADVSALTSSGEIAAKVARDQGHGLLASSIEDRS